MKNKGVAIAAFDSVAAILFNQTHSNADRLVLEYKNHPAYVLFISSLKSDHT